MTGAMFYYAHSPSVRPSDKMEFPYNDVKAWLGVGSSRANEWAYIGFSTSPNLTNIDVHDGFSSFTTRIRWNNEIEYVKMTQKWGSVFLDFQNDRDAISKMIHANTVLVELDWYGEDKVYFEFSLVGSRAAITKIRRSSGR